MSECDCSNIKPLETWIKQESTDEHCPPCLLKPLAENYLGELEAANADEEISKLEEAWDSSDLLTIAKAMDNIKNVVGEPLKKNLLALDCEAQCYRIAAAET